MTDAQLHTLAINGSRLLEYARAMRNAKQDATLIVEDRDKEEYQFWFADGTAIRVDQIACKAFITNGEVLK